MFAIASGKVQAATVHTGPTDPEVNAVPAVVLLIIDGSPEKIGEFGTLPLLGPEELAVE